MSELPTARKMYEEIMEDKMSKINILLDKVAESFRKTKEPEIQFIIQQEFERSTSRFIDELTSLGYVVFVVRQAYYEDRPCGCGYVGTLLKISCDICLPD